VLGLAGYVDGRRGHGGGGRSPVIVVNARVCVLWYLVESTARILSGLFLGASLRRV
jgi:hypothetical protein